MFSIDHICHESSSQVTDDVKQPQKVKVVTSKVSIASDPKIFEAPYLRNRARLTNGHYEPLIGNPTRHV